MPSSLDFIRPSEDILVTSGVLSAFLARREEVNIPTSITLILNVSLQNLLQFIYVNSPYFLVSSSCHMKIDKMCLKISCNSYPLTVN